jgi:AcrR family transcriptional regulator
MTLAAEELLVRRPARADARRNYDALIAAARDGFAELGTAAPLEEIARRAGVGIATLYRNFPTREALIESVYLEEVDAVCQAAEAVADLEPWPALRTWIDRLVEYVGTKRVLVEAMNRNSSTFGVCREALYAAGAPLLQRAQEADVIRKDISIEDLIRLVTGVTGASYSTMEQRDRILAIALDGLRAVN